MNKRNAKKLKKGELIEDRRKKMLDDYNKLQQLSKNHNPPPDRGMYSNHTHIAVDSNSNMINVKQGYFNKGKYQLKEVDKVPIEYLMWLMKNRPLNTSELKLINRVIKSEVENNQLNNHKENTNSSNNKE